MNVTFNKKDVMKALYIYMLLRGYKTDDYFKFRWRDELVVTTEIKPLNGKINYEALKKYANK